MGSVKVRDEATFSLFTRASNTLSVLDIFHSRLKRKEKPKITNLAFPLLIGWGTFNFGRYTFGCYTFEKLHLWTLQLRMFHLREFYLWDITPSICHTFASHSLKYFVRLDQDSGRGRREIRPVTQLFACPGFCSERGAACHQQWWPEKKCVLILIENLGIIMACL